MGENLHLFNTSNYPSDHTLYSRKNEKTVGKFKDECAGVAAVEFVGLTPKMYPFCSQRIKQKWHVRVSNGAMSAYTAQHVSLHTSQND